jgi:hypothetical protein
MTPNTFLWAYIVYIKKIHEFPFIVGLVDVLHNRNNLSTFLGYNF